jgi:hypothetical protein
MVARPKLDVRCTRLSTRLWPIPGYLGYNQGLFMRLYPFLPTVFVRGVLARTSSSLAVLTLLMLTLSVAGPLAVSCPPTPAVQQEEVSQDEPPPDLDEAEPPTEETEETRSAAIAKLQQAATAQVEAAAATVTEPDPQALAKALGVELGPNADENDVPDAGVLEPLGDLDGDGVPEMALRWTRPPQRGPEPGEEQMQASAVGWSPLAGITLDGSD